MRLIKILLCLVFYPSWSSTTPAGEKAEIGDKRRVEEEAYEEALSMRKYEDYKEYDTEITVPIKEMRNYTDMIADPKIEKTESDLSNYARACKSLDRSPEIILRYMEYRLVTKCKWPLDSKVEQLAKHHTILKRILHRFKVRNQPIPDPSIYLAKLVYVYKLMYNSDLTENDMRVFNKDFPTYEEAMDAFFDELERRTGKGRGWIYDGESCDLRDLTIKTYFNYSRVESFKKKLQNQLDDLAYIYKHCDKAKFPEEPTSPKYAEKFADRIERISSSTTRWFNESLESAWPTIHNGIFKEQIKNLVEKSENFDRKMLKKAFELTSSILNQTGVPNYKYEMLIVREPEKNFQFYFDGVPSLIYFEERDFGFDTVLVRRRFNYSNHLDQLNLENEIRRLTENAVKLRTKITEEMKNLYDAKTVTDVAEGLKNNLGDFISENGFKGFAIARKWEQNIFKSCSAIDDVQYSKDSFSSIYNFTYQNSGNMFQHCETFNFYFFL